MIVLQMHTVDWVDLINEMIFLMHVFVYHVLRVALRAKHAMRSSTTQKPVQLCSVQNMCEVVEKSGTNKKITRFVRLRDNLHPPSPFASKIKITAQTFARCSV